MLKLATNDHNLDPSPWLAIGQINRCVVISTKVRKTTTQAALVIVTTNVITISVKVY